MQRLAGGLICVLLVLIVAGCLCGAEDVVLHGSCAYIDEHYGVATTTITARDLRAAGIDMGDEIEVTIGETVHILRLDYIDWEIPEGTSTAYVTWGELRFWQRGGDFASSYSVASGDPIVLRLTAKAKFPRTDPADRYWENIPIDVASLPAPIEPVETALAPLRVVGNQIVTEESSAVVLRGAAIEDPFWADFEDAPVLRRDLAMIKSWGGNVVHIPVHPEAWKMQGALPYLEDHLDTVIQWAGEVGLYAIISWKTHGNPETKRVSEEKYDPDMVLARQALATLACRYQRCPWVLYSVFNEANSFMRWDRFEVCMTALVDAVRSESPNALVLVPGVDIAADLSDIPSRPVPRDNIVYATDVYPWVWDRTPFREDAISLLDAGYPLLIFEWGFDVREDEDRFPYCCQYATVDGFAGPLLSFCTENGISWTAWVWSNDWCPHMFYDYERLELTPFGKLVRDTLGGGVAEVPSTHAFPVLHIEPEQAQADGCAIVDRLAGDVGADGATIFEAKAAGEWTFSHWKGPVDLPLSPIASVDLGVSQDVTAIFTGPPADIVDPYRVNGTDILFDEAHEERNTLSPERAAQLNPEHPEYQLFGRLAKDISVEYQLDRGVEDLSRELLEDYRVLVISAPRQAFTEAEVREIEAFVRGGGGLLVLGDSHLGPETNELVEPFGITFLAQDVISSSSGEWKPQNAPADFIAPDHAVTQGVAAFLTNCGTAIDSYGNASVLLRSGADSWHDTANEGVNDPGERAGPFVFGVAVEHGEGRVVALSDNNFLDDAWDALDGNKTLLMNAIKWLARRSDLFVIDDFEDGDRINSVQGEWRDSAPEASISVAFGGDSHGSYLQMEAPDDAKVGIYSSLSGIDASEFEGLYVRVFASADVDMSLKLDSADNEWPSGYRVTGYWSRLDMTEDPITLRIPFSEFVVGEYMRDQCSGCEVGQDPTRLQAISILISNGPGVLRIYEVGFYRAVDGQLDDVGVKQSSHPMATPGVDGYAVILEVDEYPEGFSDLHVEYINRDRIVDALVSLGWSEDDMYTALDDDVTADALANAMDWLLERATEEDLVFVYVAAHYSYLKQVAEFDRVFPPLWGLIPTDRKVLVVDACKAGELTASAMYGTFMPPEDLEISAVSPSPGVSISACAHDEFAVWGTVEDDLSIVGGFMTYYLQEALSDVSLDADNDTYVSVEEAFAGLYPRTRAYYRETAPVALEDPDLPEAVRQDILADIESDGFPHPGMIDAFPGELILDLRYYWEAFEDGA